MQPVSSALLIVGYALAIPIAMRLPAIIANRHRLAMWGHQFGILMASLGWLLRGSVLILAAHVIWMVLAYLWFGLSGSVQKRRGRRKKPKAAS